MLLLVGFVVVEHRAAEPLMPPSLFRNEVFTVTSAIGFVVGFIMFGAMIYIPLYLQTVHGATPTSSGLQLLPLVVGMLLTFIPSGRLVTRWGRYKIFPIVGTAVMAIGLFLLSLMSPTTPLAVSSIYMFIVGLGIGLVMQVLVVAVQNAVPYSQLGTTTSAATFFRTIGGAFGVALFGTIFNNRLFAELPHYLPASVVQRLAGTTSPPTPPRSTPCRPRSTRGSCRPSATLSTPCSSSGCPSRSSPSCSASSSRRSRSATTRTWPRTERWRRRRPLPRAWSRPS